MRIVMVVFFREVCYYNGCRCPQNADKVGKLPVGSEC